MKKLIVFLVLAINVAVFAQEKIEEGVLTTKQTMSSTNEEMKAQFAMFGDMTTTTLFNANKSRSEMSHPMVGNSVTIMDNDTNEMFVLLDSPLMGKKYMQKSSETSKEDEANITVTKGDETKTILGYVCDQYLIKLTKDGVVVDVTVFTSDKVTAVSEHSKTLGGKLKGFPMLMEMNMNQMGIDMKITYEVTSVKAEAVSMDKFDMTAPEGYEKTDNIQGK